MMAPKPLLVGVELGTVDRFTGGIDAYAVPPGLGPLAGPLGALALAADTI